MFKEFKEFAMRGNAIDLAIGVIIGAAFGKIVSSLVDDVIMPPIGQLLHNVNFSNLFITLHGQHFDTLEKAKAGGAVTLNYGVFINTVINFLIVAFCVFLLVQQMNRLAKKPQPVAPEPSTKECPQCTMTIPIRAKKCPHCTTQIA